jgi:type IV secretory pathway VirB6-like protein
MTMPLHVTLPAASARLFMACLAVMLLFVLSADMAYAADGNPAQSNPLTTVDANGNVVKCTGPGGTGVLIGGIVPCLNKIIEVSGVKLALAFRALLMPVFTAFLTLVIIFFGVKLVQGEGEVGKGAFLLVIKIAFVIGFLNLFPSFIPMASSIMREVIGVVAGALIDPADFHCDVAQYLKPGGDLLWAQMDCVMGKLWGYTIKPGSGEPNMLLAASAFGMLGGIAFGGAAGMFIFLAIIGILFTLFSIIVKTMAAYINGFILVTMLIIIAPIFLPLLLLQVTSQYFEKWWKGILAAMMLPILVSTYFVIAMLMYDHMLFKPGSLVQKLFDTEFMKKAQVVNSQSCAPSMVNDQTLSIKGSSGSAAPTPSAAEAARLPLVSNKILPFLSGTAMTCYKHPEIRLTQADMQILIVQLMQLALMAYLVAQGFESMQKLVRNFGSGMTSATMDPVSSQEKRLSDAMDSMRSGMLGYQDEKGNRFADASGADFITTMPGALKGGVESFMGTMRDSKLR